MITICDENTYVRESKHDFTKCQKCGTFFDFEKDDLHMEFYEPCGRVFKSIPMGYWVYFLKCPNCHESIGFMPKDVENGFK